MKVRNRALKIEMKLLRIISTSFNPVDFKIPRKSTEYDNIG